MTLDIRSGRANEHLSARRSSLDTSIIRGDLHIIAGNRRTYENTDRTLRLS